ncbi:DNA-3-methyladenine glycosylase I [Veronia nyctiphanis]|uniref:DNA-3-methyladenine glycosylase I n=1 Tax=Veronia nyctiphanis TaxID=1278244 RepID=A0A4Q0YMN1_9GAMM|nr:DNA-3-methyladenine glycosylase I [Veronia nyctiphanis]RXJ72120.1 DNA-3-methyladenine glycosylase I [Veronia nyctiphanis]
MRRCDWANGSDIDAKYHDTEWGVPVHDDRKLFEMLCLEGAQAGLSWTTILRKRDGYLGAFQNFELDKVVTLTDADVETLVQNPDIVRHRLKIQSVIGNAKAVIEIQSEFGSFDAFIWSFVGGKPIINQWKKTEDVPTTTAESDAMSKALKKRGFKFVGSTICYAYMQGVGMVNDHLVDCFRYKEVCGLK